MTKTQSVCVCPGKKHPVRIYCLICLLPYEPVSEPASTGEPHGCLTCHHPVGYHHDDGDACTVLNCKCKSYLAARPSEPSPERSTMRYTHPEVAGQMQANAEPAAPQTSAEPPRFPNGDLMPIHWCPGLKKVVGYSSLLCSMHIHDRGEVDYIPASLQPVSRDAPKVEEIDKWLDGLFGEGSAILLELLDDGRFVFKGKNRQWKIGELLQAFASDFLHPVSQDDKEILQVIAQRDRWENVITNLAVLAGCEREWSNLHEHGQCIEEEIHRLRAATLPVGIVNNKEIL